VKSSTEGPRLFILLGLPGSGKTYLAKHLQAYGVVHLSADRLRSALFFAPKYTNDEHRIVFTSMREAAKAVMKAGQSVSFDANNNKKKYRAELRELAKKHNTTPVILWIKTSKELLQARVTEENRELPLGKYLPHRLPLENLRLMQAELEEPDKDEPFMEVSGELPFERQVQKIKEYLQSRF
jgi:predicted kinase